MPRLQHRSSTVLPQHHGETTDRSLSPRTKLRTTSAVNLSIGRSSSTQQRKLSMKTKSFILGSSTTRSILPDFNTNGDIDTYNNSNESPLHKSTSGSRDRLGTLRSSGTFRASEKGKGDILPTISSSSAVPRRTFSVMSPTKSGGYMTDSSTWMSRKSTRRCESNMETIQDMSQELRSRRRTSSTDLFTSSSTNSVGNNNNCLDGNSSHNNYAAMSDHSGRYSRSGSFKNFWSSKSSSNNNNNGNHDNNMSCLNSKHRYNNTNNTNNGSTSRRKTRSISKTLHYFIRFQMRKRDWIQLILFIVISYLVIESYIKTIHTTEQLQLYKNDESMMMLHLQRIEQQSIHLHENLARLGDVSRTLTTNNNNNIENENNNIQQQLQQQQVEQQKQQQEVRHVDSNLIRVQTQQLMQMEEELDHELRALQSKLQTVARNNIIRTYGEGPVQVVLEMDFPDRSSGVISILLWYDTPHAAWTWLQQIRKGEWNGSNFESSKGYTVEASPVIGNAGTIDFVEKSAKKHEPWTVGLSDDKDGNLRMFINLQDNTELRKRDVCVGKVIDGFDALQRLVELSKRDRRRSVLIKRASATHLTRNSRPL